MYTQQSNALAAALALPAGQQQTQALLQVFANCVQGLRQNGPVSINTAAGSQAPRAGVINTPPGSGAVANRPTTGSNLANYANGVGNRPVGQYPSNVWNVNSRAGDTNNSYLTQNTTNNYGGSMSAFFGGDTFYGDSYQTTNLFDNSQNFNVNKNTEFYEYNNSTNNTDNSTHNNNVSNWSNNQYVDNSYNDFSTTLNTTQNSYSQTVNNFAGDSIFNNTVNEGNVTNLSTVINQGNVIHQGDTYLTENKTFITNNNNTYNLISYITNVVMNIVQGKGEQGDPGLKGDPGPPGPPGKPGKPGPKYRFDAEACDIVEIT